MYPNPTKEIIQLAAPCYEALKKLIPGYEWEPRKGEWIITAGLTLQVITDVNRTLIYWPGCNSWTFSNQVTPILEWELMEVLLDKESYWFYWKQVDDDTEPEFKIRIKGTVRKGIGSGSASAPTRQQAVMQSIIELAKEVGK